MNIYVSYAEDATQKLKQILPLFTPEFTATMKLLDDMYIKVDVPITLQVPT